ncbi:MAG: M48 family metalloprotease, partial [Vicinamibacterales bacterium]
MNGLKTALLMAALGGLLVTVGGVVGGQSGLVIALVFAVAMNFGSYWFSDKIVLRMNHAREVGPGHRLYDMTARLAQRANLPMPKVYVTPEMSPNAFATGRNPQHAAVAATEGLMRLLPDAELEGVMAHELAHIQNRDILIST